MEYDARITITVSSASMEYLVELQQAITELVEDQENSRTTMQIADKGTYVRIGRQS